MSLETFAAIVQLFATSHDGTITHDEWERIDQWLHDETQRRGLGADWYQVYYGERVGVSS